jgi:hypothetical protein
MAGYSGTPLAKKLGIKPPMNLLVVGAPPEYELWLGELPPGVCLIREPDESVEAAHIFFCDREPLEEMLRRLRKQFVQTGFVWVSWPKKTSKIRTDVTEDIIREIALPIGFVDIKVCAVSEVWSGLKLVIRQTERSS